MIFDEGFIDIIKKKASLRILFSNHALLQMSRLDRMISPNEIRTVLFNGEIIEDYPEDNRGHSCLVLGKGYNDRPIHVLCAPKDEYLAIITAYVPDIAEWDKNFQIRKKL